MTLLRYIPIFCFFLFLLSPAAAEKKAAEPKIRQTTQITEAWLKTKPVPEWIWSQKEIEQDPLFLRQTVELEQAPGIALLYTTCDNFAEVWINDRKVGTAKDWQQPVMADVTEFLTDGENVITAKANNRGGIAAFVLKLEIFLPNGARRHIISDTSWSASLEGAPGWRQGDLKAEDWKTAALTSHGKIGRAPWGYPLGSTSTSGKVMPAEELTLLDGFEADLLYTVPRDEFGSWVSMATAPQGGFYVSDQGDAGLFHVAIDGGEPVITPVRIQQPGSDKPLSGAQGLLWAFDSLWFHRNGGHLYRIVDHDDDGRLDEAIKQPSSTGGGEHGNHAVLKDETGEALYLVSGNSAPLPPGGAMTRQRPQSWDEGHLLPRYWDPRGHARGRLAPGGWIAKYHPDKQTYDLINIGYRNQYDATLNSAGDLFAYDADMEWDVGSAWYRPTRINFAVSGADHGWRSGTGKWPAYYEDSLPPVVEIGPGSPTGFTSGVSAAFPEKYQRALYAFDWTFGTIWAIHLEQDGAGYHGEKEVFAAGVPLPVTDGVIGDDGHLYFLIGGRGTQSALYRIRYTGSEPTEPVPSLEPTPERLTARRLEAYHGVEDPAAIDAAWPHLDSTDRFLRHAARVAVESQPVERWAARVVAETRPQALITGAVALAREGEAADQEAVLRSLTQLDFPNLTEPQQLGYLRAVALSLIKIGEPGDALRSSLTGLLDPALPSSNPDLNTELVRVLTFLQSPTVVAKTLDLIREAPAPEVPEWSEIAARNPRYGANVKQFLENPPPSREVSYAMMIANAREGWTLAARREILELLNRAAKGGGGASFPGYLETIRNLHLSGLSDEERLALSDVSGENFNPMPDFEISPPEGPGQSYTVEEALPLARRGKADFERGRSLYFAVSCGACHRLNGLGGNIGPDLTSIPNKFDERYVLEAIIHPSRDISDQYSMYTVTLKSGDTLTGLYVENGEDVSIYPSDHTALPTRLKRDEIASATPLEVSQMPGGLLNLLNPKEVRDLMAYLMSGGDPDHKTYR